MRIASGTHKGRNINIPKILDLRPSKGIVRLAIFNILGEKVKDAAVADIFAGSGALGLEALSRGAKHCDFVDINQKSKEAIEKTINILSLRPKAKIWRMSAIQFLSERPSDYYDIIILDPPYALTSLVHTLNLCGECLKPKGLVVFEHSDKFWPQKEYDTLVAVNERKYGGTAVAFLTKKGSSN